MTFLDVYVLVLDLGQGRIVEDVGVQLHKSLGPSPRARFSTFGYFLTPSRWFQKAQRFGTGGILDHNLQI
jgi:hypothetical protein